MPRILEITPQKRHRDRWTLALDNGSDVTLDAEIVVRERLTRGSALGEEILGRLLREDEAARAYKQALRWLARRRHTRRETEQRLAAKGYSAEAARTVGERLEQRDKVDPAAYAAAFVRDRVKFSLQGPMLIRAELRERGVPDGVIEAALAEHLPAEALRERLARLCEKQTRGRRASHDAAAARRKLIAALARQGYDLPMIISVVDQRLPIDGSDDGQ